MFFTPLQKALTHSRSARTKRAGKGPRGPLQGRRLRCERLEDRRMLSVIPNDPLFSDQWTMHNTGQTGGTWDADIDAPAAWSVATGDTSMVIAVLDTGVDYTHEDLYLNIWLNQGEIPAVFASGLTDTDGDGLITYRDLNEPANSSYVSDRNGTGYIDAGDLIDDPAWADGLDTDGNGYVDDISGYDFIADIGDPFDYHQHGTFMAGLIGAVGDNATGVAGVIWNAQLMPLKFHDGFGNGSVTAAAEAIDYAVANGAQISNNSWGAPGWPSDAGYSEAVRTAIANAATAGHIVVAAAGNAGEDNDNPDNAAYPASYDLDNIIAVASTINDDEMWESSNYGSTTVDVGAPSAGWSTSPGGYRSGGSATSSAAAHATGVVALLRSQHPDWTYHQIIDRVLATVDPLPSLAGKTVSGGRVNAAAALATTSIHVSDPSIVEGDTGSSQLVFTVERRGDTAETVVLDWATSDGTAIDGEDYVSAGGQIVFDNPSENEKTVVVMVNGDMIVEPHETFYVDLSLAGGSATLADEYGVGTILNDDAIDLFTDSFENDQWNGLWVEDSQNDWFTSTQRATVGNYSAEVDGRATDATLTIADPVDLTPYGSAELTFDWYIESGFDSGEYLALDLFNGATWQEVARLSGNVDQENTWHQETVEIGGNYLVSDFQLRFRAKMTKSDEDANVDNVQLFATSLAGPPNHPPVAVDDLGSGPEDAPITVNVLVNDSDPDSDPLDIIAVTGGANGSAVDNGDGTVTYTPNPDWNGNDSFTYTISDGRGGTDTAAVDVTVASVNDPPTAQEDSASTSVDTSVVIEVLANDSDVDEDPLALDSFTQGGHGSVSDNGDGTLTYAPDAGYTGDDSFTYTISDGHGGTDTAPVAITVSPTQTVAFSDSFEAGEWNGVWIEDSQNDWFRSTQRASAGTHSAEVDGRATEATLTMANAIDLGGYGSATLAFAWLIEKGFDSGEFIALDVYDGSWHQDVRTLRGNMDQENVWYQETVDLGGYLSSNFKIRFRASVSGSQEDGNVDDIQILASGMAMSAPADGSALVSALPLASALSIGNSSGEVDGDSLTLAPQILHSKELIDAAITLTFAEPKDHFGEDSLIVDNLPRLETPYESMFAANDRLLLAGVSPLGMSNTPLSSEAEEQKENETLEEAVDKALVSVFS